MGTVTTVPPVEPGSTTTEWQAMLGGLAASTLGLLVSFGIPLNSEQQTAVLVWTGSIVAVVSAYILGRSLRKRGLS